MANTSATILLSPAGQGPWGDRFAPTHLVRLLEGSVPGWTIQAFHGANIGDAPAIPLNVGVAREAHRPIAHDLLVILTAVVLEDARISGDPAVIAAVADDWTVPAQGFDDELVDLARHALIDTMALHVTLVSDASTLAQDGSLDLLVSSGIKTVVYEPR